MAHGDAREELSGNWLMDWVASTLHITSEHSVSSITIADVHTSAASNKEINNVWNFKYFVNFKKKIVELQTAVYTTFWKTKLHFWVYCIYFDSSVPLSKISKQVEERNSTFYKIIYKLCVH